MPLTLVSSLIDPQTFDSITPTPERLAFFEGVSKQPFQFQLVTDYSDVVSIPCPFCINTNRLVKWVAPNDKGFAQPAFSHTCEVCGKEFTKSNIGVRRFSDEVVLRRTLQRVFIS